MGAPAPDAAEIRKRCTGLQRRAAVVRPAHAVVRRAAAGAQIARARPDFVSLVFAEGPSSRWRV